MRQSSRKQDGARGAPSDGARMRVSWGSDYGGSLHFLFRNRPASMPLSTTPFTLSIAGLVPALRTGESMKYDSSTADASVLRSLSRARSNEGDLGEPFSRNDGSRITKNMYLETGLSPFPMVDGASRVKKNFPMDLRSDHFRIDVCQFSMVCQDQDEVRPLDDLFQGHRIELIVRHQRIVCRNCGTVSKKSFDYLDGRTLANVVRVSLEGNPKRCDLGTFHTSDQLECLPRYLKWSVIVRLS